MSLGCPSRALVVEEWSAQPGYLPDRTRDGPEEAWPSIVLVMPQVLEVRNSNAIMDSGESNLID